MAFVPSTFRTPEENAQAILTGQNIVPLAEGAPAGSAAGAAQPAAQLEAAPRSPRSTGVALPALPFASTGSTLEERLVSPIQAGTESFRQDLGQLGSEFRELAGPQRSFGSVGGRETIRSGLAPSGSIQPIQELLQSQYSGPAGLADIDVQEAQRRLGELQARAGALSGSGGLQSLLGEAAPGLSPGERRFEAQRLVGTPGYREAVSPYQQEVARLFGALEREEEAARRYAQERSAGERGIAQKTREALQAREGNILGDLDQRIAQEEERRRRAQEAYVQWAGEPSLQGLGAIPEELLSFDPQQFRTTAVGEAERAQRLFGGIMGRYPGVAEYDPLTLRVTSRGREGFQYPAGTTGPERRELFRRQRELEGLFSPSLKGSEFRRKKEPLSLYAPLYFGETVSDPKYQLPPLDRYVQFDPGVGATRANLAREGQRERFNKIQELLGQAARLDKAGEPFRAAAIGAQLERYLEEESARLKARGERLDKAGEDWARQVEGARENFKEEKKKERWGKILGIMGGIGIAGAGGGGLGGGFLGYQIGKKTGERIA